MAKWSNMDIFGNRQKFQQGHLGIGIYIERHSQHFEPNFQYMSRCLECLTFHLVSETLLGIKLWRKYVEVFHMLKIYFELGLLQVLTIYVNCELLVREGGKDKKKNKNHTLSSKPCQDALSQIRHKRITNKVIKKAWIFSEFIKLVKRNSSHSFLELQSCIRNNILNNSYVWAYTNVENH